MKRVVYLLYECDEWLSKDSMMLMGIFDNKEELYLGALSLIKERKDEHCDFAVNCKDYEVGLNFSEVVINDILNELKEHGQTQSWLTNYLIKEVELNKLEEIY